MNDVEIATEAAKIGAEVLLRYWQHLGREQADLKGRNDWVSKADRESEAAIVSYLHETRPGDACLGEEGGRQALESAGAARRTWVIDPLDGTSNYLQHFPFWCVSIGLRDGDDMVAAVVYEPLRNELFVASRGEGAYRNGTRMRVSNQESLDGAFVATGFPFRAQKYVGVYARMF